LTLVVNGWFGKPTYITIGVGAPLMGNSNLGLQIAMVVLWKQFHHMVE
jgi:hypothetical protein